MQSRLISVPPFISDHITSVCKLLGDQPVAEILPLLGDVRSPLVTFFAESSITTLRNYWNFFPNGNLQRVISNIVTSSQSPKVKAYAISKAIKKIYQNEFVPHDQDPFYDGIQIDFLREGLIESSTMNNYQVSKHSLFLYNTTYSNQQMNTDPISSCIVVPIITKRQILSNLITLPWGIEEIVLAKVGNNAVVIILNHVERLWQPTENISVNFFNAILDPCNNRIDIAVATSKGIYLLYFTPNDNKLSIEEESCIYRWKKPPRIVELWKWPTWLVVPSSGTLIIIGNYKSGHTQEFLIPAGCARIDRAWGFDTDKFIVACHTRLLVIDPQKGQNEWTISSSVTAATIDSEGHILVGTSQGNIYMDNTLMRGACISFLKGAKRVSFIGTFTNKSIIIVSDSPYLILLHATGECSSFPTKTIPSVIQNTCGDSRLWQFKCGNELVIAKEKDQIIECITIHNNQNNICISQFFARGIAHWSTMDGCITKQIY